MSFNNNRSYGPHQKRRTQEFYTQKKNWLIAWNENNLTRYEDLLKMNFVI
jgi:hypothetical protein